MGPGAVSSQKSWVTKTGGTRLDCRGRNLSSTVSESFFCGKGQCGERTSERRRVRSRAGVPGTSGVVGVP